MTAHARTAVRPRPEAVLARGSARSPGNRGPKEVRAAFAGPSPVGYGRAMDGRHFLIAFAAFGLLAGCKDGGGDNADGVGLFQDEEPKPGATGKPHANTAAETPAKPAQPDKPAPAAKWEKDYELRFDGAPGKVNFFPTRNKDEKPLSLRVHLSDMPAGSTLKIGPETVTFEKGYASTIVGLAAEMGKLPIDDAFKDKADLGLTVTVKLAGYAALETPLPKQRIVDGLKAAFERVQDGGVAFPGEPAASGPARSAVAIGVHKTYRKTRVLGAAKVVSDIDWVVLEESVESGRSRECTGYDKSPKVTVQFLDSELRAFDRRTGALVKEGKLEAKDKCPTFVTVRDGKADARVDEDAVDKWTRNELSRGQ